MVKGLDLRSNAGNCARVRTPQLAQLLLPSWGLLFPCGWRGMPGPALLQFSGGESGLQIGCPLYTPARGLLCGPLCCSQVFLGVACVVARSVWHRGYGATVARLTPDQKVGSSNLSALICLWPFGAASIWCCALVCKLQANSQECCTQLALWPNG